MKYSIEISEGKVIEKFDFKGKEYTKTWDVIHGGLKSTDKSFDEQIEADGCNDDWVLGAICDKLEQNIDALDFWELYLETLS